MTADEARRVDSVMRALGIRGVVAPADPDNPSGEWRVYDQTAPEARRDITADVLAAVVQQFRTADTAPAPETSREAPSGPMRGFVFPPKSA